jgi:hypothetical protein
MNDKIFILALVLQLILTIVTRRMICVRDGWDISERIAIGLFYVLSLVVGTLLLRILMGYIPSPYGNQPLPLWMKAVIFLILLVIPVLSLVSMMMVFTIERLNPSNYRFVVLAHHIISAMITLTGLGIFSIGVSASSQ